jgi:hypothetical protein
LIRQVSTLKVCLLVREDSSGADLWSQAWDCGVCCSRIRPGSGYESCQILGVEA